MVTGNADAGCAFRGAKAAYHVAAMSLFESLQLLAMVAVPIFAGAIGLIVYRIRAIQSAIDRNDARLDEHGERLATLEATTGQVSELRNDVKDIHRRINEVLGKVADVDSKVSMLEGQFLEAARVNKLIHEHLLDSAA